MDGHNDTMLALGSLRRRNFHERSEKGHIDLPRMREGNFQAGLFAVWPCFTRRMIQKRTKIWLSVVADERNQMKHIKKFDDFENAKKSGKIGVVLHFEGAGGIDKQFTMLDYYYKLGLRSLSLTWFDTNKFGTGARMFGREKKRGLTDLGKNLVRNAQSMGIAVDVSHLNVPSFWDVMKITQKPILATHSDSYSVSAHRRNLTDDQIKAIQETHGAIGINFGGLFLNPDKPGKHDSNLGFDVIKNHIDQIVSVSDINTVAMGSDFDGALVPDCVSDCTKFPKLFEYLSENGYSDQDIKKIAHENWLRVLKENWK
jgi:membrane dipeptidase